MLEPHLCMPRTSQPSVASSVMYRIDSNAPSAVGW